MTVLHGFPSSSHDWARAAPQLATEHALPAWAVWASYVVAGLCLTGFWSGGMASLAFALWLLGAVVGMLRAARSG